MLVTLRELRVRVSVRQQAQDLTLALGERVEPLAAGPETEQHLDQGPVGDSADGALTAEQAACAGTVSVRA